MKKFEDWINIIGDGVHGHPQERFQGKKEPGDYFSPQGKEKVKAIIENLNKTSNEEKLGKFRLL